MSSSLRARMTVALTFAAGAFLYLSDHDTIDRHWRLALALTLGAVFLAVSPLWISARSTGRSTRVLVLAVVVLAGGSGCGTSRSLRGTTAGVSAMVGGLLLQGGARGPSEDTIPPSAIVGVGVGLVALAGILGISALSDPDPAPAQVSTFAGLPAPAAPDHAMFTRVPLTTGPSTP